MDSETSTVFFGYVKVVLKSRHPKRWGWEIFNDGTAMLVTESQPMFVTAEEAYSAGMQRLVVLEAANPNRPRRRSVAQPAF